MKKFNAKNLNNKIFTFFGKVLAYIVIIFIPIAIYFLITFVVNIISKLEQNNLVTFFSILFSSIIGIFLFIIQKYYEKRKDIDIELIKKKSEVYNKLISSWFDYLMVEKKITDSNEIKAEQNKLLLQFFELAQKGLYLWANENTLIHYSNLRLNMVNKVYEDNVNGLFKDFGNFMKLIRKELGHKDKKLKNSHIYGLYINDIDKISNDIN